MDLYFPRVLDLMLRARGLALIMRNLPLNQAKISKCEMARGSNLDWNLSAPSGSGCLVTTP